MLILTLNSRIRPIMEPVGLTIGVVGLMGQLAKAAMDCYQIFDDMSDVGTTYDSIFHRLRTEGLRLKGWEEAWGLGNDVDVRLDPGDYRYRYATATLARIVAAFASVDKLQAKYGILVRKANGTDKSADKGSLVLESEEPKPRWRGRLSISLPFKSHFKSPLRDLHANAQLEIPRINENDLNLLENPRVLANHQLLPGLPEEISAMTKAMDRVEQSLPVYRKFCWVVADKGKLDDLLRILTSLNDGLFQVLPTLARPVLIQAKPQASMLKLAFDIPFLPNINIRKSPEFVGREYLLEQLKQEVEKGKHTLNIIVLYGTGGMGKTQLALEYIHQHYEDHSSVFWINAASEETTIMGFTHIMQRLIKHHAQFSEDYPRIGRLLGMAGKLDSNGCFVSLNHQRRSMSWMPLKNGCHPRKIRIGFLCLITLMIQTQLILGNIFRHAIMGQLSLQAGGAIYSKASGGSKFAKCSLRRPFGCYLKHLQCLRSRIYHQAVIEPYLYF